MASTVLNNPIWLQQCSKMIIQVSGLVFSGCAALAAVFIHVAVFPDLL